MWVTPLGHSSTLPVSARKWKKNNADLKKKLKNIFNNTYHNWINRVVMWNELWFLYLLTNMTLYLSNQYITTKCKSCMWPSPSCFFLCPCFTLWWEKRQNVEYIRKESTENKTTYWVIQLSCYVPSCVMAVYQVLRWSPDKQCISQPLIILPGCTNHSTPALLQSDNWKDHQPRMIVYF